MFYTLIIFYALEQVAETTMYVRKQFLEMQGIVDQCRFIFLKRKEEEYSHSKNSSSNKQRKYQKNSQQRKNVLLYREKATVENIIAL